MTPPGLPIRFGVVGCGTIAYWSHLRSLRGLRGATLVAAADPDPAARARAAPLVPGAVLDDAEELFDRDDVDAVVIASPTALHAAHALAACRRRKPFYVEKPIATSHADARAVLTAAAEAGLVAAVGFNRRLHPIYERARELLAAGAIGRVRTVLSAFVEPPAGGTLAAWKRRRETGGGALLDLASHHVDLVRWLLGEEIAEVEARIESDASEADSAWLRLATTTGIEVRGAFSFRAGPADWISILGEKGTLLVDRFRGRLEHRAPRRFGYGVRTVRRPPRPGDLGWRLRRLASPSHDPSYRRSLAAFAAEVGGAPARNARLLDGARSLAVVLAAEESARVGTVVRPVEVA